MPVVFSPDIVLAFGMTLCILPSDRGARRGHNNALDSPGFSSGLQHIARPIDGWINVPVKSSEVM